MSDPINYRELEEIWQAVPVSEVDAACDHSTARVTDNRVMMEFECDMCGRHGFGDYRAAKALGWIREDGTSPYILQMVRD